MEIKVEKRSELVAAETQPYLTKRLLVRTVQRAGKVAEKEAMDVMGYVVTVIDDWVVRKNADGSIEKIKKIEA